MDLFDEIREDVKREQYAQIWNKYGHYIIGAAVFVVLVTAAMVGWRSYTDAKYSAYSDMLYKASLANEEEALAIYDNLIKDSNSVYKAIAAMRKAAIFIESGRTTEALSAYEYVASEASAPEEFRDIAKILYISISSNISAENGSGIEDATALRYLDEAMEQDSVFKYSAMEIAAFNSMTKGDNVKAKDIFNRLINDELTPQNIKTRAQEMVSVIKNNENGKSVNG